jgi:multiple antibiotic resistance protein
MELEFIKTAFLTLFVAVDPPGLAPVFLALTAHMTMQERSSTAYRSVVIAFCILAASALGGKGLLGALGIGIPAFRIAGGLLLFSIAAEMVFERREQRKSHSAESAVAHDHPKSIAAFPLAIPLMAGPGALTATILQASNAQGNWLNMLALMAILAVVVGSCLGVFLLAGRLDRLLGNTGRVILSRLLGVLLAAMAVQIVGDGVMSFVHASVK